MKRLLLALAAVAAAFTFSACEGPKPAVSTPAENRRTIEITANDQMRFSVMAIEATAGEPLRIVLRNVGRLPKQAMGHNWVLLTAGTDAAAFDRAALAAAATDYIPQGMLNAIVAKSRLLGPGEMDTIDFTAPAPGTYVFLCTFPAHFQAGMRGTLTVK